MSKLSNTAPAGEFFSSPINPSKRADDPRKTLDDLITRSIAYRSAPAIKELLAFARNLPYIAPFNAMLLHVQNPGIRFALRAPQWEKSYARRIRPGARPYVILRMMGPVEFVFDLSDTEPIDPTFDRVPKVASNPFSTNGKPPPRILEGITKRCLEMAVEVSCHDFGTALAGRVMRSASRKPPYSILLNSKHSDAQKIGTLAHELAHILCGHLGEDRDNKIPSRGNLTTDIQEFEAEAVAYLITDRMNLDIGSVSYLASYLNSSKDVPEYSLDIVLKVAGRIELMLTGGRKPERDRYLTEEKGDSLVAFPEQKALPADRIPKFLELVVQQGDELFHTPENFAAKLEKLLEGKFRSYVTSCWSIYKAMNPSAAGEPDWPEIFARIDIHEKNQKESIPSTPMAVGITGNAHAIVSIERPSS